MIEMKWKTVLYDGFTGAVLFGIPSWFAGFLLLFLHYIIHPLPYVLLASVFFFIVVPLMCFFIVFFMSLSCEIRRNYDENE